MSWQIPTLIEQDIKSGKAQYRTFQTGNGGQSILPVPSNSYVVIFGYDFSPAGGGFKRQTSGPVGALNVANDVNIRAFETQQISFYTGTDFFPFIHHVNVNTTAILNNWNATSPDDNFATQNQYIEEVDNTPIARQVYITSTNDVTISVGLVLRAIRVASGAIPVTNRTPQALTYGGSGQVISVQTDYSAGLPTPQQFIQPSPKDFQDFAFGLLPSNADGQAFAVPDTVEGLVDPSLFCYTNLGSAIARLAANSYYLNLHYALYTETVPESRG